MKDNSAEATLFLAPAKEKKSRRKDVTKGSQSGSGYARIFEENQMMIMKLMKIMKKGGEVTVTSAPGNERMSHEAANLVMLFMPAMLFTHCMYKCNLAREGVNR